MVRKKYNTPVIIKYPFWQMTAKNPKATYACINNGEAAGPKEIEHQAVYINVDIGEILSGSNQRKGWGMLAAVVVLHRWKRQMLLSIAGSTVLYMLLVQALF